MTYVTYTAYVWLYDGPGFSFWWILPLFFEALWLVFIGLLVWKLIWLRPRNNRAAAGSSRVAESAFAIQRSETR